MSDMNTAKQIEILYAHLGYSFEEVRLLRLALTHRSASDENNERLEFLGDAVVNFIIGDYLYHQFPHAQEGELSRWRATLVNRDSLAKLALYFELGCYLRLGAGELRSGGADRPSILSCTMEAIIGAVYLDGGFAVCSQYVLLWYRPLLDSFSITSSHKDPKTELQELLQSRKMALPSYAVERIDGEAHQQTFMVPVEFRILAIKQWVLARVEGVPNKRRHYTCWSLFVNDRGYL